MALPAILTSLFFLLTFYSFSLVTRGPWGALSPIPENNAITVDPQVFSFVLIPFFSLYVNTVLLLYEWLII